MKKDKDMKKGDIDFQYVNNMVVAVKWCDNCGMRMIGTCLEEQNKVSTVTPAVKTIWWTLLPYIIFRSDGCLCCKFACNLQIVVPKVNGITKLHNCSG